MTSHPVPPPATPLRVAFLVGRDCRETREPIEAVCDIPLVTGCGILFDREKISLRQRIRKLRRNIARNGWIYILHAICHAIRIRTDRMVERSLLRPGEVGELLRRAFPQRSFALDDIGRKFGMPVWRFDNLNDPSAAEALRASGAHLAIVLGTRILKSATFRVPPLGAINLHKGNVPHYRGIPAGIWELYDGARTAGVTVHFIDEKVDTGDIIATGEFDLSPLETPDTLGEKLHAEGIRVLVQAVNSLVTGTAVRTRQPDISIPPRTIPTFRQMRELRRRLPHWQRIAPSRVVLENLLYLAIFHTGIYAMLRRRRRSAKGPAKARIVLPSSANAETLAAQLLAIARYCQPMEQDEMLWRLGAVLPAQPVSEPAPAPVVVASAFPNPLWLMMEIEGCSVHSLSERFRRRAAG